MPDLNRPSDLSLTGAGPDHRSEPGREAAFGRLKAARDSLTAIAAVANKHGAFSEDQCRRMRQVLKAGRGGRRVSVDVIWAAVRSCEELRKEIERGLEAGQVCSSAEVATDKAPSKKVSPCRTMAEIPTAKASAPGATVHSPNKRKKLELAEFAKDEKKLDRLVQRRQLVRLVQEQDLTVKVALERLGLPADRNAVRTAQRAIVTWKVEARVDDRRWSRTPANIVMSEDMQRLALKYWNGRFAASIAAVHRLMTSELRASSIAGPSGRVEVPSYGAVYHFLKKCLPASVQSARGGRLEDWQKQQRMVLPFDNTEYSNHIWQIDHTMLDVHIRVESSSGAWEAARPHLTVVLDVHSRAIMGYQISLRHPDSWTTALVMRNAILGKPDDAEWPMRGVPNTLVPDRGRDFMSSQVATLIRGLGIKLDPTPPHYPDLKAEIERSFLTLKYRLAELAGFTGQGTSAGSAIKRLGGLLTLSQLKGEIERFFREYHAKKHGTTAELPRERWERTVRLQELAEAEVSLLMMQSATRKVTHSGLALDGVVFQARELQDAVGQEVTMRFNPDDLLSVRVYASPSNAFICEAWAIDDPRSPISADDVIGWRKAYARGLVERTREYAKQVDVDDRRSAKAHDDARAMARKLKEERLAAENVDPAKLEAERFARELSKPENAMPVKLERLGGQDV